jgi:hypothetical protein
MVNPEVPFGTVCAEGIQYNGRKLVTTLLQIPQKILETQQKQH